MMVTMSLGGQEFRIEAGVVQCSHPTLRRFLDQVQGAYFPQPIHRDDPDLALADYFETVLHATLTEYEMPEGLSKALARGAIL